MLSPWKIAFATLGAPGSDLDAIIALAHAHAISGLELRLADDAPLNAALSRAEREAIGRRLREAGLTVVAVDSYVRACTSPPDHLQAAIETARDVGAGAVRIFMGDPARSDTELSEGERDAVHLLLGAADDAEAAGITLALETHDAHSTVSRLRRIIDPVLASRPDAPVGIVWDAAHSYRAGESFAESLRAAGDRLTYLQLKDQEPEGKPCALGEGFFPIGELLDALAAHEGVEWLSLEWELQWHPTLPSLDVALSSLAAWDPRLTP